MRLYLSFINAMIHAIPSLTSFELNHSSGSGFVNNSVSTLFTSDGITLAQ